jgi:hypothetical protein
MDEYMIKQSKILIADPRPWEYGCIIKNSFSIFIFKNFQNKIWTDERIILLFNM